MVKSIKGLVAIDLETVPNISHDALVQLENSKISKISSNKTYKETTKQKKIEEVAEAFLEFRNGIDNDLTDEIIKDFSTNPLRNKIVAIGLTYYNESEKKVINIGKCSPDEKDLLEWMKKELVKASVKTFSDITFGGHFIRGFDIPTLKIALIRNDVDLKDTEYSIAERETIFPLGKYGKGVIDTYDTFPHPLNELALAILGEGKIEDGSMVYKLFKQEKYQEIEDYVKSDSLISYKTIIKLHI